MISTGPDWELRLGKWQDELAAVECDAIICDPPYGARTHSASTTRNDGVNEDGLTPDYVPWTERDVGDFVIAWTDRCQGWIVALTDSSLAPCWRDAFEDAGRCSFAPVPCVMRGMSVRMQGDGPSSWSVFLMVARPRNLEFVKWGTLPGAYTGPRGSEAGGGRGKPPWLLNALVRDYSRPGDLICDPFAGWGSTLSAAVANNRRALGSEMDADAFNEATRRLSRPLQVDLFAG